MAGSLTKQCSKCKETKVLALFNSHPHAKGRRRPECAECTKKYHQTLRSRKPPGSDRKYSLKKNFGLSLDDYAEMLEKQGGVCAICQQPQANRMTKLLCVDHCHGTNKVRGLLCTNCNSGLGYFKDKPENLAAAINYLLRLRD